MDLYMTPSSTSRSVSGYNQSSSSPKGSPFRQQSRHDRQQQHSVTFQTDSASGSEERLNGSSAMLSGNMERELKASIARLYQNYDFITDEYDRLFDVVDSVREDYNNTKSMFIYYRYHEFKRLIKNAIRKWRTVEKRNSLAASRKQSNASFALAINTGSLSRVGSSLPGIPEENSGSFSGNLSVRLRADKDEATKELYNECTRLEREIFQYKTRNQQIKNLLCKLSIDYENAKGHVLHIWGRYKELRQMILDVINADV